MKKSLEIIFTDDVNRPDFLKKHITFERIKRKAKSLLEGRNISLYINDYYKRPLINVWEQPVPLLTDLRNRRTIMPF